jgi:hypothetical protein
MQGDTSKLSGVKPRNGNMPLKWGDSIFSRRKTAKPTGSDYSSALNSSRVRPAWGMIARKVPFAISLWLAQEGGDGEESRFLR